MKNLKNQIGMDINETIEVGTYHCALQQIRRNLHLETSHSAMASACGKAILVGEHAVVYGAKAVAIPVLNMQVSLEIKSSENDKVNMYLAGRPVSDHLRGVVEDAATLLGITLSPMDIYGNSTILIGAGLGSSAAICVAVLKSLAQFFRRELLPSQIAEMSNKLERRFHGNPSGLDTAVVSFEQAVSFTKGTAPVPLDISRPTVKGVQAKNWRFAIIDSGLRSSTIEMIDKAAPWFTDTDRATKINQFNVLASQSIKALKTGDLVSLGQAMTAANSLLSQAQLVPTPLENIIDTAHSYGAIAAKITGAGGGGCIIALLAPDRATETITNLQHKYGSERVNEVNLL